MHHIARGYLVRPSSTWFTVPPLAASDDRFSADRDGQAAFGVSLRCVVAARCELELEARGNFLRITAVGVGHVLFGPRPISDTAV